MFHNQRGQELHQNRINDFSKKVLIQGYYRSFWAQKKKKKKKKKCTVITGSAQMISIKICTTKGA